MPNDTSPSRRRLLPLLLLAGSLVIAMLIAAEALSARRSHRATAEALLRDYAAFAAWSYRQSALDCIGSSLSRSVSPITRASAGGRIESLPATVLQETALAENDDCWCSPTIHAPMYFRMALDDGTVQVVGGGADSLLLAWISDSIPVHLRTEFQSGWRFAILSTELDGMGRHVLYTPLGEPDAAQWAYGYELPTAVFQPTFEKLALEQPLLPATLLRGRTNDSLLAIAVLAGDESVMYMSANAADWALSSDEAMADSYGGMRVRASVRPDVAGELIIGGLPRDRVPALLGLMAVAVVLSALATRQLRRESDLARIRGDFVSGVSHELRTPLAQIRLFMETLRLGRYHTAEQREWILENVDRETTRLAHLVENILQFSRRRADTPAQADGVELSGEIAEIVQGFAPLAASRRARIAMRVDDGTVVRIGRDELRQVLLNLLDNAVKYGPAGQTITVGVTCGPKWARIRIEDQGPGVPAEERERIWEPFRRGRNAVGSVAVGSGIGLSVVREIIRRHGGAAWVEDGEMRGRGASFVVELPLVAGGSSLTYADATPEPFSVGAPAGGGAATTTF